MRLPSKDTPYSESVIALFPAILSQLKSSGMTVQRVFAIASEAGWDTANFFAALDCLFALGMVRLDEEKAVLYYVETDPV